MRCGAVGLLCLVSKAPLLTLLALSRCMPWDCPHDTAVARGDVEERLAKCKYACGVVLGGWKRLLEVVRGVVLCVVVGVGGKRVVG